MTEVVIDPGDDDPATADRPDRHLSRTFHVTWNGVSSPARWEPADVAAREALLLATQRLREGKLDLPDLLKIGDTVGRVICPKGRTDLAELLPIGTSTEEIRISSKHVDPRVLTDLMWEAVIVTGGVSPSRLSDVASRSLAARPVVRIVPAIGAWQDSNATRGRLTVLLCVAAPPSPLHDPPGAPRLDAVDVAGFTEVLDQAFRPYGALDVHWPEAPPDKITLPLLQATIRRRRPHVLVLVAHGSSGSRLGDAPKVCLADGWHPVRSLTEALTSAKQPTLAVWACCDLARTPAGASAHSAAWTSIQAGVAEVVAMQGNIHQQIARRFLETFLASLLTGQPVPLAVSEARAQLRDEAHGFFPAAFRSTAWTHPSSIAGATLQAYRAALLAARSDIWITSDSLVRVVQQEVAQLLADVGARLVRGPMQSGKTHAVAAAARAILGRPIPQRPIIRLDCRLLPTPPSTLTDVLTAARDLLPRYRELLPEEVHFPTQPVGGQWHALAHALDQCRVTLIVDHPPAPANVEDEDEWFQFLTAICGMQRSLLVLVTTSERLRRPPGLREVEVTAFSPEECRDFLTRNAPQLGHRSTEIHELTGGLPTLLQEFAARSRAGVHDPARIARDLRTDSFASLLNRLGLDEAIVLHALVWLPGPADRDLATQYLVPQPLPGGSTANAALERLLIIGAIDAVAGTRGRQVWIPHFKKTAVLRRQAPEQVSPFRIAGHFATLERGGGHVKEAYSVEGGASVLRALQACFIVFARKGPEALRSKAWDQALRLAVGADVGGRITADLLELYAALVAEDAPLQVRTESLRRGALIARALGRPATATHYLDQLERTGPTGVQRAEFLLTRGRVAKDVEQTAAVASILADVEAGLEALRSIGASPGWVEAELRQLRLDTRLFLQGVPVDDDDPDVRAIQTMAPGLATLANLDATLAERLQDVRQGETIDWTRVARHLLSAARHAKSTEDHRTKSFVAYRLGRYLELRPEPQYVDAARRYEEASVEAQRAGEPRREALAGLRKLRVLRDHLGQSDPETDAQEVDRLLGLLGDPPPDDALTLRVAHRLHDLLAELAEQDPSVGSRLGPLQAACRIGARLPTTSTRDAERFAASLVRCLRALQADGSFIEAQLLVQELERPLREWLGLRIAEHDPWKAADEVSAWLARRQV